MTHTQASLLARARAHVDASPEKLFAVTHENGRERALTYAALWGGALTFARKFAERGVPRDEPVLIMLRSAHDTYLAFLGAMLHGAIPSIMPYCTPKQDSTLFWESHRRLFEHIRPAAIVTFRQYRDLAAGVAGSAQIFLDDEISAAAAYSDEDVPIPRSAIAFLQHSSGTTGLKKGVMLGHEAVQAQIDSYAPLIGLNATSVVASWLPLYHDMGLIACFIAPLLVGATVVQLDPIEWVGAPMSLLEAVETHKATHVWLPNFALNHLVASRRANTRTYDLSSLRAVIDCSEPCRLESLGRFADKFYDCGIDETVPQVCYAMAETVFAVTQTRLGTPVGSLTISRSALAERRVALPAQSIDDGQIIVSCGEPIPGLCVRIVDEAGKPVSERQVGEVCVGGKSLYTGYNQMPDLTRMRLRDGWHHTGDLGFMEGGSLFVTGRIDDLLIVRGRNYYAHDIEAVLCRQDGVHAGRTVAFTVDNSTIGTADIICLVELRAEANEAILRRTLRQSVEDEVGATISRIVFVPSGTLVKTTSGKISREANRSRYIAGETSTQSV